MLDKELKFRLSAEDLKKLKKISQYSNISFSEELRSLINYRYAFLVRNKKIEADDIDIKEEDKLDQETIDELRTLLTLLKK